MATAAVFLPVREYLRSSYEPDCDYVDGELEARSVGEGKHGRLQLIIGAIFQVNRRAWAVRPYAETRTQVAEARFRVPDLCVVAQAAPMEDILVTPPLLCVEILSPEDRMGRVLTRVDDYVRMGVRAVWVIDPVAREGYVASDRGLEKPVDGVLRVDGTPIEIVLADVFAELDEA